MVRTEHETGVEEFSVEDNVLKRNGQHIASFQTPVCELARLDDKLFVVLHPYPEKDNPEHAGTNLWALNLSGEVLWKAGNLNPFVRQYGPPISYNGLKLFDDANPKILIGTTDDYVNPILDPESGKAIGGLGPQCRYQDVKPLFFARSTRYMTIVPGSPPKKDQQDHPQP